MSISTDDVNFLVWQYFKDSGFPHSAFVFGNESMVDSTNIQQNQIPPNCLVTLLENAHKYMMLERRVKIARQNASDPLNPIIGNLEKAFPNPIMISTSEQEETTANNEVIPLSPAVASIFAGHNLEVYAAAWSPNSYFLATASADTTVILWDIINKTHKTIGKPIDENDSGREITSLDWSQKNIIASGSFDSKVRLYSPDGTTIATFAGHSHHVFSVKFNPAGTHLLSASADHTVIVWDVDRQIQVVCFNHHKDTILDIAWKDNKTFAVCSADNSASICDIQGSFRVLIGHKDHVNSVCFSKPFLKSESSGTPEKTQPIIMLATGSDDKTIRIWENSDASYVLEGHEAPVVIVQFSPIDPMVLASVSTDGELILWDLKRKEKLFTLNGQTNVLMSLMFSPDGRFIATGGEEGRIEVSRVEDGKTMVQFSSSSTIYDIKWDQKGEKMAVTFSDSTVAVIPISKYLRM